MLNKDKSAYKCNTFLWITWQGAEPTGCSNVPLKITFPLCKCQNQSIKGQGLSIWSWGSILTTWAVKRLNDIRFGWKLMQSMLISFEIVQKRRHLSLEKARLMEKQMCGNMFTYNIHNLLNVFSNSWTKFKISAPGKCTFNSKLNNFLYFPSALMHLSVCMHLCIVYFIFY